MEVIIHVGHLNNKSKEGDCRMMVWNNFKYVNPHLFHSYENYKFLIANQLFLYSERRPDLFSILEYDNTFYQIGTPEDITIPGHVTHPDQALKKILIACYEKKDILDLCKSNEGIIFVYNGFISSSSNIISSKANVQLKFLVYPINVILQ
ncbi:MAG: hypothetical protein ACXAC7_12825 [Candidatus Hodarchaeales archaeon]|jgi:hypothetical protein